MNVLRLMPEILAGGKRRRDEDEKLVGTGCTEIPSEKIVLDSSEVQTRSQGAEVCGAGESGDEYDSDEESDVEFILAPREASRPNSEVLKSTGSAVTASPTAHHTPQNIKTPLGAISTEETVLQRGTLDIDAVGQLNGRPISHFPPFSFDDKPWRHPGVDISDYFNYGFDEFTWMAYCSRQDKLRVHFTPSHVMQTMPMGGMPNPMMGMMPPFMMPMMFPPGEQR